MTPRPLILVACLTLGAAACRPRPTAARGAPARPATSPASNPLRREVEALAAEMVAAFKADPASVARYYDDHARIQGGGTRAVGRREIDRYWAEATGFADWVLEVHEVGGDHAAPWVLGRSTLVDAAGRRMVTDFVGVLRRGADGSLRFLVDMYAPAPAGGPGR